MSSASTKFIEQKEAVPIINSDVFYNSPNKRFAVGRLKTSDVLSYKPDSLEYAYLRLRSNVYIDQSGFLNPEVRRSDGTELDSDDERSSHFVVLENKSGYAAVFACLRLIEKDGTNVELPVERYFKEAFPIPASSESVEVSRFIVRSSEMRAALLAKRALITTGLNYVYDNGLSDIYGTISPEFEKSLKMMNIQIERIAEPRKLCDYPDLNLGFKVDRETLRGNLGDPIIEAFQVPKSDTFNFFEDIEPRDGQ